MSIRHINDLCWSADLQLVFYPTQTSLVPTTYRFRREEKHGWYGRYSIQECRFVVAQTAFPPTASPPCLNLFVLWQQLQFCDWRELFWRSKSFGYPEMHGKVAVTNGMLLRWSAVKWQPSEKIEEWCHETWTKNLTAWRQMKHSITLPVLSTHTEHNNYCSRH